MSGKRYSEDDVMFIVNNYSSMGYRWVAEKLNRAPASIVAKAGSLGLTNPNYYTEKEDKFIMDNYTEHGVNWCADKLGRTRKSVKGIISNRLKLSSRQGQGPKIRWSEDEINFLKSNYGTLGPTECARQMGRSLPSIRAMAKSMSMHRTRWKWSQDEVKYLMDNCKCYKHILDISNVIGRTPDAVWLKAKQLKLGVTKPHLESRRPRMPSDISKKVYEIYNGTCKNCGKTTRDIPMIVHHIIPWKTCKHHEIDNLVLLCIDCHDKTHKSNQIRTTGKPSPLSNNN